MSSRGKIEDQEQYNGIREYRNELRHEYDNPTITPLNWKDIQSLRDRIEELDRLLRESEKNNPEFIQVYMVSRTGLGTY